MLARPDTTPVKIDEPLGDLLAFLSDIDEQVSMAEVTFAKDARAAEILALLRARLAALGLATMVSGGAMPGKAPAHV